VTGNLQTFCLTISTAFQAASAPRGRGCYLVFALCLCFPFLLIAGAVTGTSFAQSVEWKKVDAAIGREATVSGDVHRYGFPRTDLNVSLDDVILKAGVRARWMGRVQTYERRSHGDGRSRIAGDRNHSRDDELIENGIEITATHNHLLRAKPMPFYTHVGGHGDAIKLATAIRAGLAASKTPLEASTTGTAPALEFDTEQLDQILGLKGKANGGVYQFALPRREPIREGEMTLVPAGPMGVATSFNFQPTGGGKAAITGDFVLAANEVNPVIRALRENEIEVTAVHSHMLAEQPRLFFMHFWANDEAIKLAKGLRTALDQVALAKD
jgi:Domain of Unknown Function (DUF1259)